MTRRREVRPEASVEAIEVGQYRGDPVRLEPTNIGERWRVRISGNLSSPHPFGEAVALAAMWLERPAGELLAEVRQRLSRAAP